MDKTPLHERTDVNKIFSREAKIGKLEPWMIAPALVSVLFGFLMTQLLSGDFFTLILMTAGPFFGWILCVGPNPKRYFSAMNHVPRWGRGRPKHKRMLTKSRAPSPRRLR